MQVTEGAPSDRQFIESYGPGRFTVSGVEHSGSILVFADRTEAFPVAEFDSLTAEHLAAAMADTGVDFILLGCGGSIRFPARALRDAARAAGVSLEPMDTGAACRTFNVLALEERRVAAALIAL